MSVKEHAEKGMRAAIEHLKMELSSIRTGRANPGILDGVTVEVYGTQMRMRDLASISTPEPRQILISPFDPSTSSAIAKGIDKASLGFQVVQDANAIRVLVPAMSEAVRKDMVKLCKKRCEEAKISIRNMRRECNEMLKKQKSEGEISEDMVARLEKSVQECTDRFCLDADELTAKKEKEVTEI